VVVRVCVVGLTTRAEREHTAACLQWGWCLTPTAIDVYVCSMLTTAERVMVVWTSSLVAVNAAAGHPGTTDAQHSTCRVEYHRVTSV
jgi:hypothetical protein